MPPRLLVAFASVLFLSCSYASLSGFQLPKGDRTGKSFFVRHQPNDARRLDGIIVKALRSRGFRVVADPGDSPDYVVSYIDKWYWDMRTYLVDFRVDVRNAESSILLGTGRSFQTSLDAMGHDYGDFVESALGAALAGDGNWVHLSRRGAGRRSR